MDRTFSRGGEEDNCYTITRYWPREILDDDIMEENIKPLFIYSIDVNNTLLKLYYSLIFEFVLILCQQAYS